MTFDSQALLDELHAQTQGIIQQTEALRRLGPQRLNARPAAKSWSALECLEHLARYGDHYHPAMRQALAHGQVPPATPQFRTGWLGRRAADSMLPKADGKLLRMNTFADKNPLGSALDAEQMIGRFIAQQQDLLGIIALARRADLARVRVPLTVPLLRFRLGDTLRFIIFHNLRHLQQAAQAAGL